MKVTVCDICQAMVGVGTYSVQKTTQVDPPSGRTETVYQDYDLCPTHAAKLFQNFVGRLPIDDAPKIHIRFLNMRESEKFCG